MHVCVNNYKPYETLIVKINLFTSKHPEINEFMVYTDLHFKVINLKVVNVCNPI